MVWDALPGRDLVVKGLRDLGKGIRSDEALLVSIGAPRLTALGIPVADPVKDADHLLWAQLAGTGPRPRPRSLQRPHTPPGELRAGARMRRLIDQERLRVLGGPAPEYAVGMAAD